MLEMTHFRAELVQLIVSRSDSELDVQRYGKKINTFTVDPIMLEDKPWQVTLCDPIWQVTSRSSEVGLYLLPLLTLTLVR